MDTFVSWIAEALGFLIRPCYQLTGEYSVAILLFVLLSKVILLPLSIWVQKNSIISVKMQPEINWVHVHHWGDQEAISEETTRINKKYHYNVWISLAPIVIQFLLLLGLVEVIYNPLRYILHFPEELIAAMEGITSKAVGIPVTDSVIQLSAVQLLKEDASAFSGLASLFPNMDVASALSAASGIRMNLFGMSLAWIPGTKLGITLVFPAAAALSSWLLCFTQNKAQVLQAEQSNWNKYGVMAFSVALSLYLGFFVPAGIAYYWVISNLMAIALMYILNYFINPAKYVDYPELRKSQSALDELKELAGGKEKQKGDPVLLKREAEDYRRFFSTLNKHLVFYSERSGFYKYYADMIASLISRTNLMIHYITNDPDDKIFELAKENARIVPYYIGTKKIVPTLMKMDADVVVMTTPDLNTYQLKRSYVRKDVEYIYTPHDAMSVHMGFREGAMDHFDTVLCVGPQQMEEIRATERVYGLPEKKLIPCGYCQLDDLRRNFNPAAPHERKRILIAPSWQEDNLLDSCVDTLIAQLFCPEYEITVRPHPEYVKRYRPRLDALISKYEDKIGQNLKFETDFSSNESIWSSDLLITDWSGIAYEFSYTTEHPTLFVNTKMKMENPNWEKIGITPLEISLRDKIGVSLNKEELDKTRTTVEEMLSSPEKWKSQIASVRDKNVFFPGESGVKAADYIIRFFTEKRNKKEGNSSVKSKNPEKKIAVCLMLFGVLTGLSLPASAAYVDPTTTTFLAQAIASIAAILGSALVILWRRMRKRVMHFFGIDPNRNKPVEAEFALLTPDEVSAFNCEVKEKREIEERAARLRYEKTHSLKMPYWKRLIYSFISCCFLSLTVFYLAPAEIYLGNYNDFFFSLSLLSQTMIPLSVLAALLVALLVAIIPGRVWYVFNTLFFGVGICCYVQALLLNGAMGTLTGAGDTYAASTVVWNLLLWGVILVGIPIAALFAVRKKAPVVYKAVLCSVVGLLLFMQTVGVLTEAGRTADARSAISYSTVSDDGQDTLAKQNNTVVFILDTASYRITEAALLKKPDLLSELDGFTYYSNASSRYSRTYPSIPYLLSGQDCDFQTEYAVFLQNAYADSDFLSGMKDEGCNVCVFTENMLLSQSILENIDNVGSENSMSLEGIFTFVRTISKVSLYRELPYLIKPVMRYNSEAINGEVTSAHNHYDFEDTFHKTIEKKGVTVLEDADSAFRFYHFNGPHPGTTLREDGYLDITPTVDVRDAVIGDFAIINAYVKALKDAGVYDETTIVITADHGESLLGDNLLVEEEAGVLMLVKPKNAHGECKRSSAPVCHEDLFATVYRGLGLSEEKFSTRAIEDIPEDSDRTRRYYYLALRSDSEGEVAKLEYEINGKATDADSYNFTGNYWDINYSTRAVSKERFSPELYHP